MTESKQGPRKIYVASSWRNTQQPSIVNLLRSVGHEVYDFRNPGPGRTGFNWRELDPNWEAWTIEQYRNYLEHPIAEQGFKSDMYAMEWADTFLLVLPCGRSAHLELGWACGKGKETLILLDQMEPELMIKMVDHICLNLDEVVQILKPVEESRD